MKKFFCFIICQVILLAVFFSCTPPLEDDEMTYIEVSAAGGADFTANFGNYGGGLQNAAYGIDNDGNIHIVGAVDYLPASGPIAPAQTIFTLPPEYRPSATQVFGVTINGFSNQFALITVLSNGNVAIGTSENLNWFSFGHLVINK
jgi:hypothetical protein